MILFLQGFKSEKSINTINKLMGKGIYDIEFLEVNMKLTK